MPNAHILARPTQAIDDPLPRKWLCGGKAGVSPIHFDRDPPLDHPFIQTNSQKTRWPFAPQVTPGF